MTPRAQQRLNSEVKKQPQMTAKDLKASLELSNISVHESTICKLLNKQGIYGKTPRRKPLIVTPQRYWQNVLWTDETKRNYLEKTHSTTSGVERAQHIIMKTSSRP